jgi:hypothetical protein
MNVSSESIACDPLAQYANTGGPMSRTRKERLCSSLLGQADGLIRCPRVIRLGLDFGRREQIGTLRSLLEQAGALTPEDLRERFELPARPLICRPLPSSVPRLQVAQAPAADILHQALLLGLCTAHHYDPQRPVLWTQTSVTRALELFDPEGFYA